MSGAGGGRGRWRRGFLPVLAGVLAYRLLLALLLGWYLDAARLPAPPQGHYFYHDVGRVESSLGDLCVVWDAYWYLNIVEFGYRQSDAPENNTAFLPAYPFLIAALAKTGMAPATAGALLSSAFFVVALWLAWAYACLLADAAAARRLVILLALFPSSWVFHMVYAESLFCAALFGFLLLYQRGQYGGAALLAAALPLVRGLGLAVLPAVAVDVALSAWRERRLPAAKLLPLAGGAVGVLAVAAFYWHTTGHPLGFARQTAQWPINLALQDAPIPLLTSLVRGVGDASAQAFLPFGLVYALVTVALLVRKRDVSTLFAAFYLLMLLRVSHVSALRYLLPLLPVHLAIARALLRPAWFVPVAVALAGVQLAITLLYLSWQFVV